MGISEYTQLDINDRADLLWELGIFISAYRDSENMINLYHLNNFYVEVTVQKSDNKIIDITAFTKGIRLEKYINKVNIKNLL